MSKSSDLAVAYAVQRKNRKAKGGEIRAGSEKPTADSDQSHLSTLAEAIASRLAKHMMAQGGEVHDDGLNESSEEKGNAEDDLSFDALGDEQFDDDQLSEQPSDSNEKGDSEEADAADDEDSSLISKIRARSSKKA